MTGRGWAKFWGWFTPIRVVGLISGVIGLGIAVLGAMYRGSFAHDLIVTLFPNFGAGLVDITITVLIIDWLYERRDQQRERDRLIRQMRSRDNGIALQAVEELRASGWLEDSSLRGVNLVGANLAGAYLRWADLRRVILRRASLKGASLGGADLRETDLEGVDLQDASLDEALLQGANLTSAQLATAHRLRGAILPDGTRYDGRFNLAGDRQDALAAGVAWDDPKAVAEFYGVEPETYLAGQRLAGDGF
jgi:hypothetical protein